MYTSEKVVGAIMAEEGLDDYIEWYRSKKLKKSLGWKTIRQHRVELGYAA